MIRILYTGILLLVASLTSFGQNSDAGNPLIRARYQVSEKLFADGLAVLEKSTVTGADQMIAFLTRGIALSGLGRFEESNAWLSRVVGDHAAEATYFMAKNFLSLNNPADALASLGRHLADKNHYPEKAIRMDPAFLQLENNREWIHLWQKDWYSETEQQLAEVDYLILKDQLEEAMLLIDNILLIKPNEPEAWFKMARISSLQKEDRQCRQALDKAWQLAAGQPRLGKEMLRFAMEIRQYDKATSMAAELMRKDPTDPELLVTRALIRILDGKAPAALKEVENIEESGITPSELYYQAGRKLAPSLPFQAETWLSKAVDSGILDHRFYYARGMVRITLEKTDPALADLAMSLDINPNQPDLYMDRAQIRYDLGDNEGACHDWQMALGLGNSKAADLLYKYCKLP